MKLKIALQALFILPTFFCCSAINNPPHHLLKSAPPPCRDALRAHPWHGPSLGKRRRKWSIAMWKLPPQAHSSLN